MQSDVGGVLAPQNAGIRSRVAHLSDMQQWDNRPETFLRTADINEVFFPIGTMSSFESEQLLHGRSS